MAVRPVERESVKLDEAPDYLSDLGRLWRETSDEGRRRLAITTFARLGAKKGARPQPSMTLNDGRDVYFNHRVANLHDDAGRPLTVGDEVGIFGAHRLPVGVLLGTRVLFRSDAWWVGPPPSG